TVRNIGVPLGTAAGRIRMLRMLCRHHRERPFDVFHAFWARGPGEVALAAARICKRPTIVHVAGGELVWLPEVEFGARRRATRALARFVIRQADRVTAASAAMLEAIERVGARPVRLPLGVDPTVWVPEPPRSRRSDRPARIVSVGSLTPVKDHATLLRALARLVAAGWQVTADL